MNIYMEFRRRYGRNIAFILVTICLVLVATNPEAISFILMLNAIGVDVFIMLVIIQLRHSVILPFQYLVARIRDFKLTLSKWLNT